MSILAELHKGEIIISLHILFVLRNTNSGPIGLKVLNNRLFDLVRTLVLGLLFSPGSHNSIFNN